MKTSIRSASTLLSTTLSTLCLAALVAGFGATVPSCNYNDTNGSTDSAIPVGDGGARDHGAGDLLAGPDLACTPEVQSCSGLCGPVRDDCTGDTFQCGGCALGTVCDLDAHACIVPKADCAAFGRTCGTTKNSCGETITCTPFTCATTDQECDPDTNQCVACAQVTCEDLGYQCGNAWLGCGASSNTTDCGTCPSTETCNGALHVCEPKACSGLSAVKLCLAAKASDKVECGVISNGCGGLVDCTASDVAEFSCPKGQSCGGAGVPNRCAPAEPPTECVAAGYTCGTLASACGGTITCGVCDATQNQVCIIAQGATAGVCGVACNLPQKTCGTDYAGTCGTKLDNNCWPNKLDCACPPGDVCSSGAAGVPGTCSMPVACGKYTSGADGQPCSNSASSAFPQGDGTYLTCPCANSGSAPGQEVCTGIGGNGAGTCCVRDVCTGNAATVLDHCSGQTLNCCTSAQKAYNGQCCTPKTQCPADGNYDVIDDGCGGTLTCNCGRLGLDNPSSLPSAPGSSVACCAKPSCPGNQCSGVVTSSCSGAQVTCTTAGCASPPAGQVKECDGSGMCCNAAHSCTAGVYEVKTDACGVQYTCGCSGATNVVPRDGSGTPVSGAHCCASPAACGTDCSGDAHHTTCNAGDATVDPDASRAPITCSSCSGSQCCNGGTCITANTCVANTCGTIDNGCGSPKTCACGNGSVCNGTTCSCPTPTCNGCNPGTQTNACGNSVSCGCGGGQLCGSSNACCAPKSCADLPAGQQCGAVADTCTGNTISCGCNPGNKPNAVCGQGGLCQCTPTKCCKDTGNALPCIQPGPYANDGCGTAGSCSS